jgi:hypothetical protein
MLLTLIVTSKGELAAVFQEVQKFLGRMKLRFPARIDLLDHTGEMAPEMLSLRPELHHECPSHNSQERTTARRRDV